MSLTSRAAVGGACNHERNGGGQVADYYIDLLRRPHISNWAMRYGADLKTPTASIQGPKVGFPTLMDGGQITAPNLAIRTAEEGWVVENEGVAPDIEVEQTPADVMAGRDPQLEKAIEVVLQALKSQPAVDPKRPPYPVKGKTLRGTIK